MQQSKTEICAIFKKIGSKRLKDIFFVEKRQLDQSCLNINISPSGGQESLDQDAAFLQTDAISFGQQPERNYCRDQLVIYIEMDPEENPQVLKQALNDYCDFHFLPNSCSLAANEGERTRWANVEWKKAHSVIAHPVIFGNALELTRLEQGCLDDAYFLASVAALAEVPSRIHSLFLHLYIPLNRFYQVRVLMDGRWQVVTVDDQFPFLGNKPAFARSQDS